MTRECDRRVTENVVTASKERVRFAGFTGLLAPGLPSTSRLRFGRLRGGVATRVPKRRARGVTGSFLHSQDVVEPEGMPRYSRPFPHVGSCATVVFGLVTHAWRTARSPLVGIANP